MHPKLTNVLELLTRLHSARHNDCLVQDLTSAAIETIKGLPEQSTAEQLLDKAAQTLGEADASIVELQKTLADLAGQYDRLFEAWSKETNGKPFGWGKLATQHPLILESVKTYGVATVKA